MSRIPPMRGAAKGLLDSMNTRKDTMTLDDIKKRVEAATPADVRYLLGIAEAAQRVEKSETYYRNNLTGEAMALLTDAIANLRAAIEGEG